MIGEVGGELSKSDVECCLEQDMLTTQVAKPTTQGHGEIQLATGLPIVGTITSVMMSQGHQNAL